MAFPTFQSNTLTDFSALATTHNANMPATVNAGDLLVAFACFDGGVVSITTPTGWTSLVGVGSGGDPVLDVSARVADGTEGGTTVNWATSANRTGCVIVTRVTQWAGSLDGLRVALGSAANSLLELVVSGSAKDCFFMAAQFKSSATAFGATPAGWTNESKSTLSDATTNGNAVTASKTANGISIVNGSWWNSSTSSTFWNVLVGVLPVGGIKSIRPQAQIGV